jgi:hypothetical protein
MFDLVGGLGRLRLSEWWWLRRSSEQMDGRMDADADAVCERMDVGPEAGLREATGYSDSARSDQCVVRRSFGVGGGDNG